MIQYQMLRMAVNLLLPQYMTKLLQSILVLSREVWPSYLITTQKVEHFANKQVIYLRSHYSISLMYRYKNTQVNWPDDTIDSTSVNRLL